MGYILHFLLQTTLVLLLINICLVFVPRPIRLLIETLTKVLLKIILLISNQLNTTVKEIYKNRTKKMKVTTEKQPSNVIPLKKKSAK